MRELSIDWGKGLPDLDDDLLVLLLTSIPLGKGHKEEENETHLKFVVFNIVFFRLRDEPFEFLTQGHGASFGHSQVHSGWSIYVVRIFLCLCTGIGGLWCIIDSLIEILQFLVRLHKL